MGSFTDYLRLGYQHIVDIDGLDHVIFLIALIGSYQPKSWWKLILAATFFTIGHSLSLTLSAFDLVKLDKDLVEFLIPVTILATALFNLTKSGQNQQSKAGYWLAGLFGLIHGLGFANYYRILTIGDINYWDALLPFNLGVELGILLVVLILLIILVIFQVILNRRFQVWNLFVSGMAFGLALLFCVETWPF